MGQVYKNAGPDAARIAGNMPEMDAAAARAKAVVLGFATPHSDSGQFVGSIHVRNVRGRSGVRDRIVESNDPNALAKEYGHWWVTPDGKRIKWVTGIRVFNRAFDVLKKG